MAGDDKLRNDISSGKWFVRNSGQSHPQLLALATLSRHTQRISHAVDVVEPRGNQSDLQNSLVVKADGAQRS